MTLFIRVTDASVEDKRELLRDAVGAVASGNLADDGESAKRCFERETSGFSAVPGSPFAYWVSDGVRLIFVALPSLSPSVAKVCAGPDTGDDFRFLRLRWEAQLGSSTTTGSRWCLHAKGGGFSPYYSSVHLLLNWTGSTGELSASNSSNISREPD